MPCCLPSSSLGSMGRDMTRLISFTSNFNERTHYKRTIKMDKRFYPFTKDHMWILFVNRDMLQIDIIDYGQSPLKGIVFINLSESGKWKDSLMWR